VREIKRKVILGTVLSLSLAMIITVAAIAPTIAVARNRNDDDSLTQYMYGGQVTAQLPEDVPSHPTTLLIAAVHYEKGDYPLNGLHDILAVYIWIPELNSFPPAVAIGNNANPDYHNLIKEIYNGTPL